MMTRGKGRECKTMLVNIDNLVSQGHFLRKLDATVSFDFVYEIMALLYSDRGRPSVDPVLLIKMLLVGYFYNIDSERKLEEEVKYNIAYRWFLGLNFDGRVPDHSTFSQNRRRRFHGHEVFREIFERIVQECVEAGLVKGENVGMDSTQIQSERGQSQSGAGGGYPNPAGVLGRFGSGGTSRGIHSEVQKSVRPRSGIYEQNRQAERISLSELSMFGYEQRHHFRHFCNRRGRTGLRMLRGAVRVSEG